jgi:hypothetical protein
MYGEGDYNDELFVKTIQPQRLENSRIISTLLRQERKHAVV